MGSIETTPVRAGAQVTWLAASAAALVAVAVLNVLAGGGRWWANAILLPAAAAVAAAVPLLRAGRRRAAAGYALLSAAVIVCAVGALLLFGAMGRGWPLMIVLPCLAIVGTLRWGSADANGRAAHRTVVALAGLGALLGVAFLLIGAGWVDAGGRRWWTLFIVAAGAIAIVNGAPLLRDPRGYRLSTAVLLTGLGAVAILTGLRLT